MASTRNLGRGINQKLAERVQAAYGEHDQTLGNDMARRGAAKRLVGRDVALPHAHGMSEQSKASAGFGGRGSAVYDGGQPVTSNTLPNAYNHLDFKNRGPVPIAHGQAATAIGPDRNACDDRVLSEAILSGSTALPEMAAPVTAGAKRK
jgi:hypothetical protein